MKQLKLSVGVVLLGLSMLPASKAHAEATVTVNGTSYACTNWCNVTTTKSGGFRITDCCGGSVRIIKPGGELP